MQEKERSLKQWRRKIVVTAWLTYASFYLTRVNISAAVPAMIRDLGITKTEIGLVSSALFFAYAFGQLLNGQFADKFGARRMVFFGLTLSAVVNVFFGFTSGWLAGMILLWALNGYFQSMGWSSIVKTIAAWFERKARGKVSGVISSSYILGSAASLALAGFVVGALGWRWAFFAPAAVTIIFAIYWWLNIRESCEEVGFEPVEAGATRITSITENLRALVSNKGIWLCSVALFGLNIVRYSFLSWAPTYFFEVQKAPISMAAYKSLIFPLAGALGAVFTGWASDKLYKGRRAPLAIIMLTGLAGFSWIFPRLPVDAWMLGLVTLAIIGFLTFGPHMLIVTALPMDLGSKQRAASATGFIDCWGYIGASLTGVGTGFLLDHFSWNAAFYFWVSGAVIAALMMLILWISIEQKKSMTDVKNYKLT